MSKPVYIIAGEVSGDLLGARLMHALKLKDSTLTFAGVGGSGMIEAGLTPEFPMSDLAVMGVAEVLQHAPNLLRRIGQTVDNIVALDPKVVVTIDAPDFCFRVARRVKVKAPRIKFVHYVAPSVWAWRPKRAAAVAKFLDHLLALLPFEPPYFEQERLACTFVGHPAVEASTRGNASRFRQAYQIPSDKKIIALLPGSRTGELNRLLPLFLNVAADIQQKYPDTVLVLPAVSHLLNLAQTQVKSSNLPVLVIEGEQARHDCFAASHAALAASGTVALELALAGVPTIIAYKAHPLTAFLAKRLVKLKYVSLPNIILDDEIMREFMQEAATKSALLNALEDIYQDTPRRQKQLDASKKIALLLQPLGATPSERAADIVFSYL